MDVLVKTIESLDSKSNDASKVDRNEILKHLEASIGAWFASRRRVRYSTTVSVLDRWASDDRLTTVGMSDWPIEGWAEEWGTGYNLAWWSVAAATKTAASWRLSQDIWKSLDRERRVAELTAERKAIFEEAVELAEKNVGAVGSFDVVKELDEIRYGE